MAPAIDIVIRAKFPEKGFCNILVVNGRLLFASTAKKKVALISGKRHGLLSRSPTATSSGEKQASAAWPLLPRRKRAIPNSRSIVSFPSERRGVM